MSVSKSPSQVSTVALPVAGAVHLYQTEAPPASPAWSGSPDSFVALMLSCPSSASKLPDIALAFANASFSGGAGGWGPPPSRSLTQPLSGSEPTRAYTPGPSPHSPPHDVTPTSV